MKDDDSKIVKHCKKLSHVFAPDVKADDVGKLGDAALTSLVDEFELKTSDDVDKFVRGELMRGLGDCFLECGKPKIKEGLVRLLGAEDIENLAELLDDEMEVVLEKVEQVHEFLTNEVEQRRIAAGPEPANLQEWKVKC